MVGRTDDHKKLEDQRWYHGLRPREAVLPLMRHRGDFLVRAQQKGEDYSISVNVHNGEKVDNFMLSTTSSGEYYLHALRDSAHPSFASVQLLVKHYKEHRLPNNVRLDKGVRRPRWLLANDCVKYEEEDKLGSGNFSDVFKGYLVRRNERIECAIKVMKTNDAADLQNESAVKELLEARISLTKEADIMSTYQHTNVVQFYGIACDHPPLMLVLEMCKGGSLDRHLRENGQRISGWEKTLYVTEVARGMRYLHKKKCIHRDLAARNVLISSEGCLKIADFGLSRISQAGSVNENLQQFPLQWMAPECIQTRDQQFSTKTDVWAYGVLMFEVFSNGEKPFGEIEGKAEKKAFKAIRNGEMPPPPESTPPPVVDIVKSIWQKDPEARPTFPEILEKCCDALRSMEDVPAISALIMNDLKNVKRMQLPNLNPTESTDQNPTDKSEHSFSEKKKSNRRKSVKNNDKAGGPRRMPSTKRKDGGGPRRKRSAEVPSTKKPASKRSNESVPEQKTKSKPADEKSKMVAPVVTPSSTLEEKTPPPQKEKTLRLPPPTVSTPPPTTDEKKEGRKPFKFISVTINKLTGPPKNQTVKTEKTFIAQEAPNVKAAAGPAPTNQNKKPKSGDAKSTPTASPKK